MSSRATPPSVFCPDLTFVPQPPHEAKRPVPLNRPVNVISTPVPGAVTPDGAATMSRVVVLNIDGQLYIRDLYGRANLHYNGQPATEARLRDGDRVRLGKIEYAVVAAGCTASASPPPAAAPAVEILADGSSPVRVRTPVTVVAPTETADLRLPANGDAAACAMILRLGDLYWLWNLEPATELRVNGQVVSRAELTDGSQVSVGGSEFRVRAVPVAVPPKTKAAPSPQRVAPPAKQGGMKPVPAPKTVTKPEAVPPVAKPKPPAATPFAATAVLTPDAGLPAPAATPPRVPAKASTAPPADAPKSKALVVPAGKPRVNQVVDKDDAEAIKRWGPLAFAVAAADRPELQNGHGPMEPPPEFPEEPSHKGRRIAVIVIMVLIVAALAGGAYYAWRYIR